MPGPGYRITGRAEGAGPPAAIRLRRFLKGLPRAAGLRAVRVEELPDSGAGAPAPGEPKGGERAAP
jgi:hypothetical protein